jgi:hypothetical protein
MRARLGGALPPRAAHGAEAHVVGDVVREDSVGDEPRRPISEIRPVPPANQIGITTIIIIACG